MSNFAEFTTARRRLELLRILVKCNGEANEGVLSEAVRHRGYAQAARDDIRADINHLFEVGCTAEEWFEALRVVKLTVRGEDAAWGRVTVAGVAHEIWRGD
jgi:hypothetical protein